MKHQFSVICPAYSPEGHPLVVARLSRKDRAIARAATELARFPGIGHVTIERDGDLILYVYRGHLQPVY